MSAIKKRSFFAGLFLMKCPNCRQGRIFENKHIFPLNKCLKIAESCKHCGLKLVSESNNGPGINYALTVIVMFLNLLWYVPIFGISYLDNSIYYFLTTSVVVVVLMQPWLMRLSRSAYLYIAVKYQSRLKEPSNTIA